MTVHDPKHKTTTDVQGGQAGAGPTRPHDMCSQKAAMTLARRLERFWHERGYQAARFWAEPIAERFAKVGTYELYRVACNLVNGLPPVYRESRSVSPQR